MISEKFKNAVQSKNIERAKIMLKNSLTMDLTYNQFQAMLEYALKYIPNIIEKHDGEEFEPKSNWDKSYVSKIKVELVENFSVERIEHIKKVQQYVYEDELKQQIERQSNSEVSKGNSNNQLNENIPQNPNNIDAEYIITLIATLGVAVASILIGVVKGLSIVTVATTTVLATVVVGGVTYYIVKK